MRVPYNYLPYEFERPSKIFKDWRKLIKSTDFTLGSFMENFERKFASYVGGKYCIGTNNGTDALILCLKSLGIKSGDEVITVCNTFYATVGAIIACGAKPIFVDSDSRFQINVDQIYKKINSKTKAIIPVHWAGASPNIKKIIKIAKQKKIHVIEDACMGIGALVNGKSPGTFGIVNAFSMHPLKSLNVMGDGGMVVTNNLKIYQWIKKYRNHGMISRNEIEIWGVNMRLQPLQAIVAQHGLKKINRVIRKRNQNAKYMDKYLSKIKKSVITIPPRENNNFETFALYMCLFESRDKLLSYLIKNGIEAKIHYPIPLHLQKAAFGLKYKKGSFPNAENQADKLITLPIHQFLEKKHLDYMIKIISFFYNNMV